MIVGKGNINATTSVAISLVIPKLSIDSTGRYWENADSYNGQNHVHLQAKISTTAAVDVNMYLNSSEISNKVIEWYYR